jgi:hypothetical protein
MAAEKRGTPVSVAHPNAYRTEVYEKRRHAAKLRREGWSWDEIAEEVGYSSRGAAHSAVKILLQESCDLAYAEANLYRAESLERLTKLLKAVWPRAMAGDDKSVSQARLLISQMDDLTGVKAPLQVEFGEGDVNQLLREAEAELGRRTAATQVQASRVQADPGADHSG